MKKLFFYSLILFIIFSFNTVFAANGSDGGYLCLENGTYGGGGISYYVDMNSLRVRQDDFNSYNKDYRDPKQIWYSLNAKITLFDNIQKSPYVDYDGTPLGYIDFGCDYVKIKGKKQREYRCKTLTFRYSTDNRACKKSEKLTSADGHEYYSWFSCPVPDNNEGIASSKWAPKDTKFLSYEYDHGRGMWKVTLTNLKNVSVGLLGQEEFDGFYLFANSVGAMNGAVASLKQGDRLNDSTDDRYHDLSYIGNTFTFYTLPGEQFYIVLNLFQNGDICDGTEVYHFQGVTSYTIPNNYPNTQGCINAKNEATKAGSKLDIETVKSIVPECFSEITSEVDIRDINDEYVNNELGLLDTVAKAVNGGIDGTTEISNEVLQCDFSVTKDLKTNGTRVTSVDLSGNSIINKNVSNNHVEYKTTHLLWPTGTHYWNAVCNENVEIFYNNPRQLSAAGKGFMYPVDIKVSRSCSTILVKKPQFKRVCSYAIECWGGPVNHHGEGGAGPNEAFDNCIMDCDGGAYTNECINSCYQEEYSNKTFTNLMSSSTVKLAFQFNEPAYVTGSGTSKAEFYKTTKKGTKRPLSSVVFQSSNHESGCNGSTYCTSTHGIRYTYLDACNPRNNIAGTNCYEVFTSDKNCLPKYYNNDKKYWQDLNGNIITETYAATYYAQEVAEANRELVSLKDAMNKYTAEDKFYFDIRDDYTGKYVYGDPNNGGGLARILYARNAADFANSVFYTQEEWDSKFGSGKPVYSYNGTETNNREVYIFPTSKNGLNKIANYSPYVKDYSSTVTKYMRVSLPNACLAANGTNLDDPDDVYYTNGKCRDGYNQRDGVFYTNLNSPGVNNVKKWAAIKNYGISIINKDTHKFTSRLLEVIDDPCDREDINIKLRIDSLGSFGQIKSSNVDCFYGVPTCGTGYISTCERVQSNGSAYTGSKKVAATEGSYYVLCPDPIPGITPPTPTPEPTSTIPPTPVPTIDSTPTDPPEIVGPVSYKFRTIDLEQMFQEEDGRPPRYNWSKAQDTISKITQAGYSIYSDDEKYLDYTIKVTKENLNNIRKYNKEHDTGYNDFSNLDCTYVNSEGIASCKSALFENNSKTKYGTLIAPSNRIGCNDFGTGSSGKICNSVVSLDTVG